MNALRIAHVDTERTWRGGQQQVLSLIRGLSSRGHFNFAVVKKGSSLAQRLAAEKIPMMEINPLGEMDFVSAARVAWVLRKQNIQVVHAHSAHGVALAAFSNKFSSIPYVITRRVDFHLSKNPLSKWKYSGASGVIAISNRVKDVLLEDGVPEEKITFVPSGVDFERFKNVRAISRKTLGFQEGDFIVGQVAALAPHKDQGNFLRALAHLSSFHSRARGVLVGEGALKTDLENLAKELGINDKVIFTGFREDSLDYLKSFDVFCLSSKEEGLGTSILDAMALGVPVVATRAGGIPDLVKEGETGFLAPIRDPIALSLAIEKVLNLQQAAREKLIGYAREYARVFDVEHTISGTLSVYQKIIETQKRI